MTNRTIQLRGQGYGSEAAITVSVNAATVFSGSVYTVDQAVPVEYDPTARLDAVLCTFELDTAFDGLISVSCAVDSGTVMFTGVYSNYVPIPNPVYTTHQREILSNPASTLADRVAIYAVAAVPALTQAQIDFWLDPSTTLEQREALWLAHNCQPMISSGQNGYSSFSNGDARINPSIDGVAQTPVRGDLTGTWWYQIASGSTLAYQVQIDPVTV